jgi:hypothetical protein
MSAPEKCIACGSPCHRRNDISALYECGRLWCAPPIREWTDPTMECLSLTIKAKDAECVRLRERLVELAQRVMDYDAACEAAPDDTAGVDDDMFRAWTMLKRAAIEAAKGGE